MFCRKNQWEGKNFPKHLFYDSNSKRGNILIHSKVRFSTAGRRCSPTTKMILGIFEDDAVGAREPSQYWQGAIDSGKEDIEDGISGWVYVGSHNFSSSAWGRLSGSSSIPSLLVGDERPKFRTVI